MKLSEIDMTDSQFFDMQINEHGYMDCMEITHNDIQIHIYQDGVVEFQSNIGQESLLEIEDMQEILRIMQEAIKW